MGFGRRGSRGRAGGAEPTDPGAELHHQPVGWHRKGTEQLSKVVGIDLGTTNSLVAYVKDGVPIVIRDRSGDGLVPSVVSVTEDGTVFVGREAQRRLLTEAGRTAY